MKVSSISLNFTKGTAVKAILEEKDIKTRHYYPFSSPDILIFGETQDGINNYLDAHYDKYDGFVEFPYSMSFEHLYKKDPDTKFIYVNVPKEKWVESMMVAAERWGKPGDPYPFEEFFCNKYSETGKKKMQDLTEEELGLIYDSHADNVKSFFEDKDTLLTLDHDDPEFSEKISDFISN